MAVKKILLTGASGFLGQYLLRHLMHEHYEVITVGRNASNSICCDLSTTIPELPANDWDIIIHAAGQTPYVDNASHNDEAVRGVNVAITKNLLQALQNSGCHARSFVFISSVAVYGLHQGLLLKESTSLNGTSGYAMGKIEAEQLIQDWCLQNSIPLSVLRLPLVVGEGAKGSLAAMETGLQKGRYFNIGDGKARKSMVLAQDVPAAAVQVAGKQGIFHLTDGHHASFAELSAAMAANLKVARPRSLPFAIAKILAIAGDFTGKILPINSLSLKKITSTLTFDDTLARQTFNWQPGKVLDYYTKN